MKVATNNSKTSPKKTFLVIKFFFVNPVSFVVLLQSSQKQQSAQQQ
jgi:hypothetical protein